MAILPSEPAFSPRTHDLTATPKRSSADIQLDRHIKRWTFYLAMLLLLIVALGAAYLAFIAPATLADAATKEWARATLSAIVGGVVGYAFAKK